MSAMDDMMVWLTALLDETESNLTGQNAALALHPELAEVAARQARARIEAERTILEEAREVLSDPVYGTAAQTFARFTVRRLAHGHRHDAPGFDPSWLPEEASTDA